ncbi:sarcosine oxidase subunit gamma [Paracoccus sulfuroxidans]|uniref:Sarcosine oxidase subunit gamma n=1 Tax=Paracoccus sulfuroxidans TaxID=384678 RepID=A0A562NFU7_9RHOB|nr:sarcosine oxidase subunit gamma family protein [Paracoccus sulfuroxidans]TWI31062.1 sarcosine oxidase subunit gamma [Paracoccus sulfuroxidans]
MAEALAKISQVQGLGMIQIRANLLRSGEVIARAVDLVLPAPMLTTRQGERMLGWMSPDELILIAPQPQIAGLLAALEEALEGHHALVVDVSDMRVVFDIQGARADQALAKLCPADAANLPEAGLRRTRAAQAACGFWRHGQGFRLMGFRSVADYLRGILEGAAAPGTHLDPR